jgi:diguanylate cyclase (GGDEF)-like protein
LLEAQLMMAIASTASPDVARRLRVLVVDDDEDTRRAMGRLVAQLGHDVAFAADGEDALAYHRVHPADVILADWSMPRMGGPELCRRIRESNGDDHYTYLVLVTAHDQKRRVVEGLRAGADEYLVKPLDIDVLDANLVAAERLTTAMQRRVDGVESLRRDSERFFHAARTDALTTVGNRLLLDEDIAVLHSRAVRYPQRYTLALADVDFFKKYNDRYGHLAGDEALRVVAHTMRETLRSTDAVYRYGGEEFVAILPEQSAPESAIAMERVRAALAAKAIPHADGVAGLLTISVGVAELSPSNDLDSEAWLQRADAALYRAKAEGRDRVSIASPS